MASLTFTCSVALFSALFAMAFAAGEVHQKPSDKCYEKYTTCCYKYYPCGQVEKSTTVKSRCDFSKCGKVCTPKCHIITTHAPKKVCDNYGKCHTTYAAVKTKECKQKCMDECKQIQAVCPITKVFASTKFCARLSCGGEEVVGDAASPEHVVSAIAKKVKTLPGRRKILGVEGLDKIVDGCSTSSCSVSGASVIAGGVSSGLSGGHGSLSSVVSGSVTSAAATGASY